MTRKLLSAILALALCFSLAATVSADSGNIDFIIDDFGYLSSSEVSQLNDLAATLYDETGVGFFFVYARTDDVVDYDVRPFTNGMTDYVVMLENEEYWYIHKGGRGEALSSEDEDVLRSVYNNIPTFLEAIEAYLGATASYFYNMPAGTEAIGYEENEQITYEEEPQIVYDENERFLYDEADLLNDADEARLIDRLEQISHTYQTQLVVYTMPALAGGDVDSYVDYLYDTSGFGYGENHEGVLLLVCMDPREYRILSNGYAGIAVGTSEIDALCDIMNLYLPDGHYSTAFLTFADQCGVYLDHYQNGVPFDFGGTLLISLAIGLIVGLIVAFILKGQLKSVRTQNQADVYMKRDSLHVTTQYEIFLYRNVTRTRKPDHDSSSSSSGSGGSTRSKGGGSF